MIHPEIKQTIYELATIEETSDSFISCYLDVDKYKADSLLAFLSRIENLKKKSNEADKDLLERAITTVNDIMTNELDSSIKGLAVFIRLGKSSYTKSLKFKVPVKNEVILDSLPMIFPLIELKDTFHSFIIVISNESHGRILEVSLGEVTESVFKERPELRKRVGREWTREHYQNHRRERGDQFVKEKIKVIEELVANKGYSHIILAGKPHMTARILKEFPKHLSDKVVDSQIQSRTHELGEVLKSSIEAFVKEEQKESHNCVAKLMEAIARDGLAVAGPSYCLRAMQLGQVDTLIMSQNFQYPVIREELMRLAVQQGLNIETVHESDVLESIDGVGCLLRYRIS